MSVGKEGIYEGLGFGTSFFPVPVIYVEILEGNNG